MTRQHHAPVLVSAALLGLFGALPARAAEHGLQIIPEPKPLLALLLLFLVLVPLLDRVLFTPLLRVLDEREARIAGARSRAGELAEQSLELLARHDAAVAAVREEANAERLKSLGNARLAHQEAVAAAREQAEREIVATRTDVEGTLAAARARLRRDAEPLAREIAERLLGRGLA